MFMWCVCVCVCDCRKHTLLHFFICEHVWSRVYYFAGLPAVGVAEVVISVVSIEKKKRFDGCVHTAGRLSHHTYQHISDEKHDVERRELTVMCGLTKSRYHCFYSHASRWMWGVSCNARRLPEGGVMFLQAACERSDMCVIRTRLLLAYFYIWEDCVLEEAVSRGLCFGGNLAIRYAPQCTGSDSLYCDTVNRRI